VIWDGAAWSGAVLTAAVLRFEFDLSQIHIGGVGWAALTAIVFQITTGTAAHAYHGRHCVGSVDDALNLTAVVTFVGAMLFGLNAVVLDPFVPRSVPLIATLLALALIVGSRVVVRRLRERSDRPDERSAERVIVFGSGVAGQQLVRSMLSDPQSGYLPVALLDDDPEVRHRRVDGVPVRGTRADLADVAGAACASLLVVALRSPDRQAIREIAAAASSAGLGVKVVPPLAELLRPWVSVGDLRDLDITDLLGRRQIDIDVSAIAGYVSDRIVLVTGAGGSIGSELCRQIHRYGPAQLLMLDRDESALHGTQLSIYGSALLDSPDVILADIRDRGALDEIFDEHRPDVVFHAAALKHLPLLEQYPEEGWKTNVVGTCNVLEAAKKVGVAKFVNISTDKAANPCSVLGRSKRLGEMLAAHEAITASGNYLSVRFGNVLGSRGSVLTTFVEQITAGRKITVTHPDVTRFFMTIPEAVQLVIYAAAIGRPGEALVLDMGEPVRIVDFARQIMVFVGRRADIVFTGLREGEKLHEELFGSEEIDHRPFHPAVSHVRVPPLEPAAALDAADRDGAAKAMVDLTALGTMRNRSSQTAETIGWQPA
jgi:FlaA1/EpsC-like NDP-sugar epimerase